MEEIKLEQFIDYSRIYEHLIKVFTVNLFWMFFYQAVEMRNFHLKINWLTSWESLSSRKKDF